MVCLALYNFFQSIINIKSQSNSHTVPVYDAIYEWNSVADENSIKTFKTYSEDTDISILKLICYKLP